VQSALSPEARAYALRTGQAGVPSWVIANRCWRDAREREEGPEMADAGIEFSGLNLVARDVAATVEFYRLLGFSILDEKIWRTDSGSHHTEGATLGGTFEIEIDSPALASVYNAGYHADSEACATVIGFRLPTREAVDDFYGDLIRAGYRGRQQPYDTFWGARYAIVADPDGRDVGLMSPSEPARRSAPPEI
jgi:uncharacterized glyoxalase superfamily protein PhnB